VDRTDMALYKMQHVLKWYTTDCSSIFRYIYQLNWRLVKRILI